MDTVASISTLRSLIGTPRAPLVVDEPAMPVYDALYAWCREAQGEPHSWSYPS